MTYEEIRDLNVKNAVQAYSFGNDWLAQPEQVYRLTEVITDIYNEAYFTGYNDKAEREDVYDI